MKPLLLIAIAILAVGCGKKKVANEVVEPVDGSNPKPEGVSVEKLEPRESIWYLKDSETPYTGNVYSLHPNGKMKSQRNYKDGKLDGLVVVWHENGQKGLEGNWKDGKEDGLQVMWYKNGKKRGETNIKDGKFDGLRVNWHENGEKHKETNYKNGMKNGLQLGWHENGQKAIEENYKDGKKIYAKFWNSKGEPVDSQEEAK